MCSVPAFVQMDDYGNKSELHAQFLGDPAKVAKEQPNLNRDSKYH